MQSGRVTSDSRPRVYICICIHKARVRNKGARDSSEERERVKQSKAKGIKRVCMYRCRTEVRRERQSATMVERRDAAPLPRQSRVHYQAVQRLPFARARQQFHGECLSLLPSVSSTCSLFLLSRLCSFTVFCASS